ncbi:hypothetical protein [Arsenophonus apicola]|nr:hypothetical protein [Arsenophonus apicola]UBX30710.1 hypothetical protein LDL57_15745 [Arsenophonus apicola]
MGLINIVLPWLPCSSGKVIPYSPVAGLITLSTTQTRASLPPLPISVSQ